MLMTTMMMMITIRFADPHGSEASPCFLSLSTTKNSRTDDDNDHGLYCIIGESPVSQSGVVHCSGCCKS
uniref:Putative secreted protein n=1 Tax=Anopheles marajoara TaxID=58244 RepID=A0A2M4CEQ6_9DIPT